MSQALTTWKSKRAATLSNPTSAAVFVTAENSANAAVVYFPIITQTSAAFRFRARGRSHAGTSGNWTPAVQFGSSATAGSNTTIATATARTNANDCAWLIEGMLFWDSTKQQLGGTFMALNGSTVTQDNPAATTTKTSVDLSVAGNALCCTGLFGTSNAANNGFLDELSLEVA